MGRELHYPLSHRRCLAPRSRDKLSLSTLAGTEEALLFPSGFSANLSVMAAVASDPGVEIFSDELNHASLVDGLRLAKASGAKLRVYRHNDMEQLAQMLEQAPSGNGRSCGD